MASENAEKVLSLVEESPGKWTRRSLLTQFDGNQHSVSVTISKLLSEHSGKLKEVNGRLFLADVAPDKQPDAAQRKSVPPARLSLSQLMEMPAEFEIDIDEIPDNAKSRNLKILFMIQLGQDRIKRIGIAQTRGGEVFWMPSPAADSTLRVYLGDYEASSGMELMNGNYLVVVVPKGDGKYKGRYIPAPFGQLFALEWD